MNISQNIEIHGKKFLEEILKIKFTSFTAIPGSFSVINPFSGAEFAAVVDCGTSEIIQAIEVANLKNLVSDKFGSLRRVEKLRQLAFLISENQEALAWLITSEQGKPLSEAFAEVGSSLRHLQWFLEPSNYKDMARVVYGSGLNKTWYTPETFNLVAAITPWNFPLSMVIKKVAPAYFMGIPIILKPAEETPLSALAIKMLANMAGIENFAFQVIPTSSPNNFGNVICSSRRVDKISFTGSLEVGKLLLRQSADTVKSTTMELGGNAPFIVFADADINAAVLSALTLKFRNSGQVCLAPNRFLIHHSVLEEFTTKFYEKMLSIKLGDGLSDGTTMGPVINDKAKQRIKKLVLDSRRLGAKIITIGNNEDSGNFLRPVLVTDVDDEFPLFKNEIFGPVVAVSSFDNEEEAVVRANKTEYGLAAYLWTADEELIYRIVQSLQFGMVGVNGAIKSDPGAPFGGKKQSGIGREGGEFGLREYLDYKYVTISSASNTTIFSEDNR